ncbi:MULTISPECIES: branched-chain amino acid ABC transporter permease [Salinibaculum]|uniref:branched-chain amino acid ABC transporter permease n=1 Tax=Salinibaculum TaxID=2732368 RepID=UPI0030CC2C68
MVLFLVLYPGVYHYVGGAEGTTVGKLLFPSMSTMLNLLTVALFAMSFDFISGYTGYLSFGHSLFFGTGVFLVLGVYAGSFEGMPLLGWIPATLPFMVLMLVAGVLSIVLALLVGAVSFRLTGVYFAMITLGFAELARFTAEGFFGAEGLTLPLLDSPPSIGLPFVDALTLPVGPFALRNSPVMLGEVPLLGLVLDVLSAIPLIGNYVVANPAIQGEVLSYYLVGLVVLLCYLAMQRFIHSPFGRVMVAIRENEERAKAIGYDTFRYKMGAFGISAFFAGVAGALFAVSQQQGDPARDFGVIERAGEALVATLIGGIGTLAGPFYGYLFDFNLREIAGGKGNNGIKEFLADNLEWLLNTGLPGTSVEEIVDIWIVGHPALYIGIVFILFILFVPGGLLGTLRLAVGGKLAKTFPDWLGRRLDRIRSVFGDR